MYAYDISIHFHRGLVAKHLLLYHYTQLLSRNTESRLGVIEERDYFMAQEWKQQQQQ